MIRVQKIRQLPEKLDLKQINQLTELHLLRDEVQSYQRKSVL